MASARNFKVPSDPQMPTCLCCMPLWCLHKGQVLKADTVGGIQRGSMGPVPVTCARRAVRGGDSSFLAPPPSQMMLEAEINPCFRRVNSCQPAVCLSPIHGSHLSSDVSTRSAGRLSFPHSLYRTRSAHASKTNMPSAWLFAFSPLLTSVCTSLGQDPLGSAASCLRGHLRETLQGLPAAPQSFVLVVTRTRSLGMSKPQGRHHLLN